MDVNEERTALLIFERKIFRRIYGRKCENGEWKSRTNRELEETSKGENIVKWIKEQRISWLGHQRQWRRIGCPKRSSLKNWKGREVGEDPGKDGKWKCNRKKMEGHCSTGQSPQWALVPMGEEEFNWLTHSIYKIPS